MNTKRKNELDKYWLQVNKMHRELKYMKYDSELNLDKEITEAMSNVEKIKTVLEKLIDTKRQKLFLSR